jgi:hypothetical protein
VGAILLAAGIALVLMAAFTGRLQLLAALASVLLGILLLALGWLRRTSRSPLAVAVPLAVAPLVLMPAILFVLVEVGETAVLRTADGSGRVFETRLWVVDHADSVWIGAGTGAERRWFRRLKAHPRVELLRRGVARCSLAVPIENPQTREVVFRRMREKYAWGTLASSLGNRIFFAKHASTEPAVIRLDPCPGGDS